MPLILQEVDTKPNLRRVYFACLYEARCLIIFHFLCKGEGTMLRHLKEVCTLQTTTPRRLATTLLTRRHRATTDHRLRATEHRLRRCCMCTSAISHSNSVTEQRDQSTYNFNTSYAKVDVFSYLGEHERAWRILEHHRAHGHPLGVKFYNKLLR